MLNTDRGKQEAPHSENDAPQPARIWTKYANKKYCWDLVKSYLPIVDWLPHYQWKEDIVADFFAGITLAFINIPQGLAFSVLANAPLVSGLYTACFSSLVYAFLGTARVSAYGPVAVGSILTGESVANYMTHRNMSATPDGTPEDNYVRVTYLATLTFLIGLMYFSFFLLRMSVVQALFTKGFVSGFVSGCCVHILSKSTKMLFGLKIKNVYGQFVVYKNFKSLILKLPLTHVPTLIFSSVAITIFLLNIFVLRKLVAKVTKFVVPIEAVVLIGSVIISYLCNFKALGFDIVGYIPSGLPHISPIDFHMLSNVFPAAVTISLINYATSLSMILAFNPGVARANQETLAMAASNLICCNIQCITIGNSMMRTIVAMNLGIKTQLSTIISSTILVFVLLFAGPLFEPLPSAALGCIIVVAISQLLIQNVLKIHTVFKISIEDGLIWIVVFLSTILLDMQIGLIVGFVLTLRQLLVRVLGDNERKRKEMEEEAKASEPGQPEVQKLLETPRAVTIR